jgi:hypothetical protein
LTFGVRHRRKEYARARRWLFSRRADLWFACGGASSALLLSTLLILVHGDHPLGTVDFVLGELVRQAFAIATTAFSSPVW